MSRNLSELWAAANEIKAEIQGWIRDRDGKDIPLEFKRLDQARLLRLRVWSWRYKLGVADILDLLVPILRDQMGIRKRRVRYGLGIRIITLTGRASERILEEEIRKKYPDGELPIIWKVSEQDRQLEAERAEESEGLESRVESQTLMKVVSIEDYVQNYSKRVMRRREEYRKCLTEEWRRRKNYRGNPWI